MVCCWLASVAFTREVARRHTCSTSRLLVRGKAVNTDRHRPDKRWSYYLVRAMLGKRSHVNRCNFRDDLMTGGVLLSTPPQAVRSSMNAERRFHGPTLDVFEGRAAAPGYEATGM